MRIRRLVRDLLPPLLIRGLKRVLGASVRAPEWEYVGRSWPSADPRSTGWDVESVVETQRRRLAAFREALGSTSALGASHEGNGVARPDYGAHNTYMTFAYVVARASRGNSLSMLDWGGGLGQYYLVARALFPDLALEYHCVDLPKACLQGSELIPEVSFHEPDDAPLSRRFDLVLSSSSLQYVADWKPLASALADAAGRFLLITRLPVACEGDSFVVVQRPAAHGYETEYIGWVVRRDELVEVVEARGLHLDREFLVAEEPTVVGASEQPQYRGFLFRR